MLSGWEKTWFLKLVIDKGKRRGVWSRCTAEDVIFSAFSPERRVFLVITVRYGRFPAIAPASFPPRLDKLFFPSTTGCCCCFCFCFLVFIFCGRSFISFTAICVAWQGLRLPHLTPVRFTTTRTSHRRLAYSISIRLWHWPSSAYLSCVRAILLRRTYKSLPCELWRANATRIYSSRRFVLLHKDSTP